MNTADSKILRSMIDDYGPREFCLGVGRALINYAERFYQVDPELELAISKAGAVIMEEAEEVL